ncbi:hypothetical protein F5Y13DRAFT_186056 [Hypoxylon sp. FL1857]|nr:hypothetical protein F5Y13DRAFT_186056 [Hypoxylon sp. FL1857]
MAQDEMVNKGLAQVYTGLGILLGAGRISSATHERILALINANQDHVAGIEKSDAGASETPSGLRPGKETPVSATSHDLLGIGVEFTGLSTVDKWTGSPSQSVIQQRGPSQGPSAPTKTKSDTQPKIICPWWSTKGYSCRDHEAGKCPMYHEDIPGGIKDPLICHFWADGGRCTKSEGDCRFAHYPARHRITAPPPGKKKAKNPRPAPADISWPSRPTPMAEPSENRYWKPKPRPRPEEEW